MLSPQPRFKPLHPAFTGTAKVLSSKNKGDDSSDYFIVDLDNGTCTCKYGSAFVFSKSKSDWVPGAYCNHKLRAIADIVNKNNKLLWPYIKALSTRYNQWETVSCFHKELRRADHQRAFFWFCILTTFRGLRGAITYMNNIVYEETRDHKLGLALTKLELQSEINFDDAYRLMYWFCASKKKWELKRRLDSIFKHEMLGYSRLMKRFGSDVAKSGDIIPAQYKDEFMKGLLSDNPTDLQVSVKGLLKSQLPQAETREDISAKLLSRLKDKDFDLYVLAKKIIASRSKRTKNNLRYHDINMLADLITHESYSYGISKDIDKQLLKIKVPDFPIGIAYSVPLYAQDNHTWYGKQLMRRFPNELKAGANQEHLDFRWCGAYCGVAWRYLAHKQFAPVHRDRFNLIEWSQVKWPTWLWRTVNDLWY